MIARIYTCFGLSGLLSVVVWLAAAIVCVKFLRHARRERHFASAVAVAAVGLGLALWNTARTNAIGLDRTDEIRAAREVQLRLLEQEAKDRRAEDESSGVGQATVRFAEDAPGEAAGVSMATLNAGVTQMVESAGEPVYRARGKQKRAAAKATNDVSVVTDNAARTAGGEEYGGVTLKLDDYQLANRLSRVNLLVACLVFWVLLGILVGDYLRRFNHPVEAYWPVPIAGPLIDAVSPKPLLAFWTDCDAAQLKPFLEAAVRKRQPFVYVGDRLAASDLDTARIRIRRHGWWRLPVLTWGRPELPNDQEFLFDAVWFNRYGVIVPSAHAEAVLAALLARLTGRAELRAVARQLPHLIWDAGVAGGEATVRRLGDLCAETGVRLVLVGQTPPRDRLRRFVDIGAAYAARIAKRPSGTAA